MQVLIAFVLLGGVSTVTNYLSKIQIRRGYIPCYLNVLRHENAFRGVAGLLEVLALIDDGRARLLIVGDDALRADMDCRAKELGVAERMIFAGRVANSLPPVCWNEFVRFRLRLRALI
jgi:glycosyltransferase involved in cell wall biosynthesis